MRWSVYALVFLCAGHREDAVGTCGEEAALGDADRGGTVDDVVNLVDGPVEADGVGGAGGDDGTGCGERGGKRPAGVSVAVRVVLPTERVARSCSTWLAMPM